MAIPAPASPVTGPGVTPAFVAAASTQRQGWGASSASTASASTLLRGKRRYDGVAQGGSADGAEGGDEESEASQGGHPTELGVGFDESSVDEKEWDDDDVPPERPPSTGLSYVEEPDTYVDTTDPTSLEGDDGYVQDQGYVDDYERSPSPIVYARPVSGGEVSPLGGSDEERRRVAAAAMGIFSDEDDEFGPPRRGRYPYRRPTASSSHHSHHHHHAQERPGDMALSPVEQIEFARRTSVSPSESFRARSRRSSLSSNFDDRPEVMSSSDDSGMMSVGATRRRRVKRELLRSYRNSYRLPPQAATEGWVDEGGSGRGSSSNLSMWNRDGEPVGEGRGRGKTRKKSKSKSKKRVKKPLEVPPGGEEKKRGVLDAVSRAFDFDRDERDRDVRDDGDRDSQRSGDVIDVALFKNFKAKRKGDGGVPPFTTNAHAHGIVAPASPIGASPMPNHSSNPNLYYTHSNTSSNSGHYPPQGAPPQTQESGGILDFAFPGKRKQGKKGAVVQIGVEGENRPGTADSGSTGRSIPNPTPSSSSQQSHNSASPFVGVSRANAPNPSAGDEGAGRVADPAPGDGDPKGKRPLKKRTASVPAVGFDSIVQGSAVQKFQPQRREKQYEQERTTYDSDAGVLSIASRKRLTEGRGGKSKGGR